MHSEEEEGRSDRFIKSEKLKLVKNSTLRTLAKKYQISQVTNGWEQIISIFAS